MKKPDYWEIGPQVAACATVYGCMLRGLHLPHTAFWTVVQLLVLWSAAFDLAFRSLHRLSVHPSLLVAKDDRGERGLLRAFVFGLFSPVAAFFAIT
jgi:hypothetical protein